MYDDTVSVAAERIATTHTRSGSESISGVLLLITRIFAIAMMSKRNRLKVKENWEDKNN